MSLSGRSKIKWLAVLWLAALSALCGQSFAAQPAPSDESQDTLYLRDGSVIKGTVIKDGLGHYLVQNKYGEFYVEEPDILHKLAEEGLLFTESYFLIGKLAEVLSVLQREVPERAQGSECFNLLVPGTVEGIYDDKNVKVIFQSRPVGGMSRVMVRYGDVAPKGKSLFVTARQKDILKTPGPGAIQFQQQYTVETDGVVKVAVKYPAEWTPIEISPKPALQAAGLIVWKQALKRQQNFGPSITFREEDGTK